jgi:hypothetical protein
MGKVWGALLAFLPALAGGAELTITADPSPAQVGQQVVFTFAPAIMQSADQLTFDFGDGATAQVQWSVECALFGGCRRVTHTYLAPGSFTVHAAGKIGGSDVAGSVSLTVNPVPQPADLYVLAAASVRGTNDTNWRTDLEVHNAGDTAAAFQLCLLRRGNSNLDPTCKSYSLPAGQTRRFLDVVANEFGASGAFALRLGGQAAKLLAGSRTYNAVTSGSYGQFVPVLPLSQSLAAGEEGLLLQLSHDPSLVSGFRTNLGLLNATAGEVTVTVRFYNSNGGLLGQLDQPLKPYEYTQLDKVLERVTEGPVEAFWASITCSPQGARIFAYASVVDNRTGDAILVPLQRKP